MQKDKEGGMKDGLGQYLESQEMIVFKGRMSQQQLVFF
jgi:hypothetical protein